MSSALERTGYFPPMLLHLIASGESSGQLDSMLEKAASHQERELSSLMAVFLGLFERASVSAARKADDLGRRSRCSCHHRYVTAKRPHLLLALNRFNGQRNHFFGDLGLDGFIVRIDNSCIGRRMLCIGSRRCKR